MVMKKLLLKPTKYKVRCGCCGKTFIPVFKLESTKRICHECYDDKKVYAKYLSNGRFKKSFMIGL